MTDDLDLFERAALLAASPERTAPAFQSVLAAVDGVLCDVRAEELAVSKAAISLAHREKVNHLLLETDRLRSILDDLREHSATRVRAGRKTAVDSGSWWFALAEATHTIEHGIDRVSSLVGSQPRGCAVRDLAGSVVRMLRAHHGILLGEAGRWIEA